MGNTVRIGFHSSVSDFSKQYYMSLLSQKYEVVVGAGYDYYIAGEGIYWNKDSMKEFLCSDKRAIRIMGCGEAVYPDLNLFDYAIWHCGHYKADDRIIYDPLIRSEIGFLVDDIHDLDNSKKDKQAKDILAAKNKFCNFIYSNSRAHPMRDAIFNKVSEYQRVDSLGRHLNNVPIKDTRNDAGWEKISIEMKRPYKFSISAENAMFAGYTSEKIMSSMLADSIPIYWGDPYVGEQFNEEAFININKCRSLDDALRLIVEIDRDDDRYLEMMCRPWRTREQIIACDNAIIKYERAFMGIFEQGRKEARRRPRGTWPDVLYPNVFLGQKELSWRRKIMEKMHKCLTCLREEGGN